MKGDEKRSLLFIQGVLLDEQRVDILIEDSRIAGIDAKLEMPASALLIDGSGKAVFPTFANMHTHAAMTLFRGFGDDHPLQEWLQEWIWPNEKNLTEEIIYWGTRLACLEMIKSGTTAFADMYFHLPAAAKAVEESGIRALLGYTVFDFGDPATAAKVKEEVAEWHSGISKETGSGRISYGLAPHAPYTVSDETLSWLADYAAENGLKYHIHMSETESEVRNSIAQHGRRPYEHLHDLGILQKTGDRFIGAHSLHLTEEEAEMIGRNRCNVVHNPNSNLKLGSGYKFLYQELSQAGCNVTLGTDGCSSSNNLDMLEATKTMALLQKGWRGDPTTMPAREALEVASRNGYRALGLDGGQLRVGFLADLMLVDINNVAFLPHNANTLSNLIYAAHSDAIDTVICNGQIVMEGRRVADEDEIMKNADRMVGELIKHRP